MEDTVTLKQASQPGTTQVRHACADAPYVNLYGAEDLPAAPFEIALSAGMHRLVRDRKR
ncbi:hypothetical protein [Massilia pseudoviolaceinigra]|uniref:hypothetical protein n=1 Tax=Massilia pseudoviolaceinigra TaxID=3057165 RepID=UPI002796BC80|nr:hypothetical protein [Massilia sp. CCM 9206]MDQ1919192.1 hypothetical protein [Massilia sp. CCM 9206]